MQRQFGFCMLVRQGDETARYDRFSILASAFWESDDLSVRAKTVAEMAALASEIASLPLRD